MTRLEAHQVANGLWASFRGSEPIQPPPPGPVTGDHFYATSVELDEWYSRTLNGPYRVAGDVSANSPGDWQRIDANAENFRSNPSQGRWVQPGTGYIKNGDPWPGGSGSGVSINNVSVFMDAAFKAMLTGDADLKSKVKTELLWQIREPSISSLNYSRWDPDYPGFWPSPIFGTSRWIQRWFAARDFLGRDYFTTGENEELDRWFYGHANYFAHLLHKELSRSGRYPNRLNEDWSTWTARRSSVKYAWEGGQTIDFPAMIYNNRQSSMGVNFGVVVPYLKRYGYAAPTSGGPSYGFRTVDQLVHHSWVWFNELLISTIFPVGAMGDFERGSCNNPVLGRGYSLALMGAMSELADAHARIGDFRLYDLTTTFGYNGTQGTPTLAGFSSGKSLLFVKTFMMKYGDGSTYASRTWCGNSLYDPRQVTDLTAARANLFYNDAWLKSAIERTASGFPNYPSSPTSSGSWGSQNAWRGEQNHSVGLLFQYGQMQNLNVYGG